MGATLADLNGDGLDDLAGKVFQYSPRITRVVVLHGHPDGLHIAPLAVAKAPGMDGIVASPEGYGGLVATDFNGDGPVDLVVSAGTTAPMTMSVALILGTGSGLGSSFVESPIGIAKRFTIQALSLSGGTHPWLVLGNPEAEVGSGYGTGLVGVLRGTPAGTAGPVTVWTQDSPGIKGKAESGDSFGILG